MNPVSPASADILPSSSILWCTGFIPSGKLREDAEERLRQRSRMRKLGIDRAKA